MLRKRAKPAMWVHRNNKKTHKVIMVSKIKNKNLQRKRKENKAKFIGVGQSRM